jgi:hypothetical protein
MPAPKKDLPKQVTKPTPIASKPAPKKTTAPQSKKKGIDAALDGLE